MRRRPILKILATAALAAALAAGTVATEQSLRLRRQEAAPAARTAETVSPAMAFTTVVFGGFRGLIADFLWLRLIDLCSRGEYFEVVPVSEWITRLEPELASVWVFQSWNMGFNISFQFLDPRERWDWIRAALELLTGRALEACPRNTQIARETAWTLLIKVANSTDPYAEHYMRFFLDEAAAALDRAGLDPETLLPRAGAAGPGNETFIGRMRLGPMRDLVRRYGPLDWRLPETHALYWAALGLDWSPEESDFGCAKLIQECLTTAFIRGKITSDGAGTVFFHPRPELARPLLDYFAERIEREQNTARRLTYETGRKHFLLNAAYLMERSGRGTEAEELFARIRELCPGEAPQPTVSAFAAAFETSPKRFVTPDPQPRK